jgi:hypothetical protein
MAEPAQMTVQQLRAARKQLARQPRRIIFNNDGCDVLYFPGKLTTTPENLLGLRTTPLVESQVDSIAYCSISSGFSYFTHNTKTGQVLSVQPSAFGLHPQDRHITRELIDQGADCLELMVRFAHRQHREIFWSMRMNDTHDAEYSPQKPYLLYPKLKMDHPDWLVGNPINRSRYGRWSSVDYAVPEIRQLAFSYIEEVCRNYDVDGVELDFFRHLCYFKSTTFGGKASQAEREMMTGLLKRVRLMSEEQGARRGRPILISVRVPDSVDFCREMGLDIERWLGEGLVDMLITTCYFRLNPWSYSVQLGHRYGVPVTTFKLSLCYC